MNGEVSYPISMEPKGAPQGTKHQNSRIIVRFLSSNVIFAQSFGIHCVRLEYVRSLPGEKDAEIGQQRRVNFGLGEGALP